MKIGIDISQSAYEGTGVGNLVLNLTKSMIENDSENEYILFFSSLRRNLPDLFSQLAKEKSNIKVKKYKLPPLLLDFLWNRLHILPIELFVGDVDIFISSDWVQPPSKKAKNVTILYDLIVYKYPEETHNKTEFNIKKLQLSSNIVASQKRRLKWVKEECEKVICISNATKHDAKEILNLNEDKLEVVYPGI